MFGFMISGLSVASDIALPGLIALSDPPARPDVRIRAGEAPLALDDATDRGPNWQIAGDRFVIAVPGLVRMLITGGAEIVYALEDKVPVADAAVFISGTGFGILLHQRERVVLHASAVSVNGSAALFCGPSGAGKSTIAAALVDAGYDLVTDDFCAVSIDAHGLPWVEPDGRQLKLWQNSIAQLALDAQRADPVRLKLQKFYVEPRAATLAALPLAAVYVLRETRAPLKSGVAQPNIVDGATMLRNNAYRPSMVRRMGQQPLYFAAAATICRKAGVFTLTRPLEFEQFPAVIDGLETHWRTLGLLEQAA